MKPYTLLGLILTLLVLPLAFAGLEDVQFPVEELGGCTDETACKAYCDLEENHNACWDFAVAYDLIPQEEIDKAKRMKELVAQGGPGGCVGDACHDYCSQEQHFEECDAFAQQHDLHPPEHHEMKKKLEAIGGGPEGCGTDPRKCAKVCERNPQVCHDFMEQHQLHPPEHYEILEKIKAVGGGPNGCQDPFECHKECENPDNFDACHAFMSELGLLPPEQLERLEQHGSFEHPTGPGGCTDKETCQSYCSDEHNFEECADHARKMGHISEEEHQFMAATGGRGPGGCKGEEECRVFCDQNPQECQAFGEKHGLHPPDHRPDGMPSPEECEENPERCEEFFDKPQGEPSFPGEHRPSKDDILRSQGIDPAECEENPSMCEEAMQHFEPPQGPNGELGNMPPLPEECKENPETCKEFFENRDPPGEHNGDFRGPNGLPPPMDSEKCKENPEACKQHHDHFQEHRPNGQGVSGPGGENPTGFPGERPPMPPECAENPEKCKHMFDNRPHEEHQPGFDGEQRPNEHQAGVGDHLGRPDKPDGSPDFPGEPGHKPPQHQNPNNHNPQHNPGPNGQPHDQHRPDDHRPDGQHHQGPQHKGPDNHNPGQHQPPQHQPNNQPSHQGPDNHDNKPPQHDGPGPGGPPPNEHKPLGIIGNFLAIFR